jgi:hypothetical protein
VRTLSALASCVVLALGVGAAGCKSNDAGAAPTPKRTLVTRQLTVGSPHNLLLDPFVGGELKSGWGLFSAHYDTGATAVRQRTFLSASPVGGGVSVELVPAGGVPSGASSLTLTAPFLGGPGSFHADVWVSASDATGAAVPFASVASAVTVAVTSPDSSTSTALVAGTPQTFGAREWVSFSTSPDIAAAPAGGWIAITFFRVDVEWMLAAPEVTSSALAMPDAG